MTSISTVLFYGQLVATLLTLFVVPVVYLEVKLLEGRRWWPHPTPAIPTSEPDPRTSTSRR
jgi:hypothetical protein